MVEQVQAALETDLGAGSAQASQEGIKALVAAIVSVERSATLRHMLANRRVAGGRARHGRARASHG